MKAHLFRQKMEADGVSEAAILAFEAGYEKFASHETGKIPEGDILPVESLPALDGVPPADGSSARQLTEKCAVLKLNGGLGTSMGLEKAKSLLPVRGNLTFLDLIVRQILHARKNAPGLRFFLMNSFSTSADTKNALARYPEIGDPGAIELLQNKVPKIDSESLAPVEWPANPELEWCPPGHGDLYAVLAASGILDDLIAHGIEYLFVSNSDNLGASLDPALIQWFARSGAPFAMEVTARTPSDRKGGHLAIRGDQLVLRESAQCPDCDIDSFQDIDKHRFFNTNNLWLRVAALRDALAEHGGYLRLPVICNQKTVDPRDKNSPKVVQLETAMGAAIECFPGAAAIIVPRSRFAPVKTTGDLLALRSDAYLLNEDSTVTLDPSRNNVPPKVDLDSDYKLVELLDRATPHGPPSLIACRSLQVTGPFRFGKEVIVRGDVTFANESSTRTDVPSGTYEDTTWSCEGYNP